MKGKVTLEARWNHGGFLLVGIRTGHGRVATHHLQGGKKFCEQL